MAAEFPFTLAGPTFDDPETMDSELYEDLSVKLQRASAILKASASADNDEDAATLHWAAWDIVDQARAVLDAWWHAGFTRIPREGQAGAEP